VRSRYLDKVLLSADVPESRRRRILSAVQLDFVVWILWGQLALPRPFASSRTVLLRFSAAVAICEASSLHSQESTAV
jgi:hypothetical protein